MIYAVAWSVIGAVMLFVAADLLMPDGETRKYVKGIISVAIIVVAVSGVSSYIKTGFNLPTDIVSDQEVSINVDENFIRRTLSNRADLAIEHYYKALAADGIRNVEIICVQDYGSNQLKFTNLYISTSNAVIDSGKANIVVRDRALELAKSLFDVRQGGICLDGTFI